MSLVQEGLNQKPSAGISLKERVSLGSDKARETALALLDKKPAAGLSARQWADLGLESALKAVEEVEKLVNQ
ncbi:MAG: hypothetical protein ABSE04_00720 [Candidatus Microgenomates bacterium]|jgi:hypothetical protein